MNFVIIVLKIQLNSGQKEEYLSVSSLMCRINPSVIELLALITKLSYNTYRCALNQQCSTSGGINCLSYYPFKLSLIMLHL